MPHKLPTCSRRHLLGTAALATLSTLGAPLPSLAASTNSNDSWQPVLLPRALQRDVTSRINGRQYRIFVSVPATPAPPTGYPVLYALDGNASFPTLALMARTTARRSGTTGHTPPVIVGIGYPVEQDYSSARGRDYTPPGAANQGDEGGADAFLDFVERELKPLIATLAPLDPSRQALYGHSYGGLCTLHALFTRPALFNCYLAASPSIWYGKRTVLAGLPGFEKKLAALPSRPGLMLAAGELEQPAATGQVLTGRQAIAAERRMIDEARELAERLQAAKMLPQVQFHLLAGENHGSATFPAMARGLEFFLG